MTTRRSMSGDFESIPSTIFDINIDIASVQYVNTIMDQKTVFFLGCHVGIFSANKLGKRQIMTAKIQIEETTNNNTTQIKIKKNTTTILFISSLRRYNTVANMKLTWKPQTNHAK